MAQHYKQMVQLWNKKKPPVKKIRFLLLAEKIARRNYIDQCGINKPDDKIRHVLDRYPMFIDTNFVRIFACLFSFNVKYIYIS